MKRKLSLLLVLAMLVGILAGCGSSDNKKSNTSSTNNAGTSNTSKDTSKDSASTDSSTPSRTDLNVSINKNLTSLDPHGTVLLQDNIIIWQIFSGLLHFNELTGTTDLDLAESYEISDDGLVYTFKLREDVYFHNGDPMTANDVVFSIKRCMDPSMGRATYTSAISDVVAVDDYTVEITLKNPSAPFLANMCYVFVISEKELNEQGAEYGTKPLSGTGPYMVTELDADQKIVLNAFDKYYKGEASIKTVNFHIVTDSAAGMISFESGDLDWYACTSTDFARLQGDPNFHTEAVTANHTTYMALNPNANEALANEKVRQAIAYAINKEELNYAAFDGMGAEADFYFNPNMNVGAPGDGFYYEYNPEKAQELLAEAGYPDGVNVGNLLCFTGSHFEICATTIQAQLAKVGIQCELEWNEQGVALTRGTNSEFDMIVSGGGCAGDYDDIRKRVHTTMASAYIDYSQTEYDWQWMDNALDEASAVSDPAKRLELNREHNDYFMKTATQLPLVHKCVTFAWDADLNVGSNRHTNPVIYDWSWN